jgi:nitronate monooxygenase
VLAGGISDGVSVRAAEALGCDLAYMGTRFIATAESRAASEYKSMLVEATLDDVMTTRAFTGLDANMLRQSILRVGLDPERLEEQVTPSDAAAQYGGGGTGPVKRWAGVWSAGHSVSGVHRVSTVAEVVREVAAEYEVLPTRR